MLVNELGACYHDLNIFYFYTHFVNYFIFVYYTSIIVDFMCRMEENNNDVDEIMKDDFEEGDQNEKRVKHLKSDVCESFSNLLRGKKKSKM